MSKDLQKSVRFSAKSESKTSEKNKDESNSHYDIKEDSLNSLTTHPASPPYSPDEDLQPANLLLNPESSNSTDFQPPNSGLPTPDKPSLHDTAKKNCRFPTLNEKSCSFVETIRYPLDNGVKLSSPSDHKKAHLRDHPPELVELIQKLEINHFGEELEKSDVGKMFSPRGDDELQDLTDRLQTYIKKMRELRNGAPGIDSHSFFKAVDAIEREMKNLKIMYESEIKKLRDQLSDANRQKSHMELQNSKLEAAASDLQNRMAAEIDKSKRLMNDINVLQRSIVQKEQEIQGAVQQSQEATKPLPDMNETSRRLDQTLRENLDLHHRYETELLQRKDNEAKVHELQEQINFNDELNRQNIQDLQDRLAAANTAILNLEGKVRVLDRPDHEKHIADMLSSVRDAAERELYKYKQDAEETFSRNVTILKSQMDADRKSFEAVTDENRKLAGVIEELNTKIRNLQGEIIHMEHVKRSAEENLQIERERATRHIQAIEGKLKDLQDTLFDKMKELNEARIQNLPLKAEVESLRALIDEEEKRLAMEMKLPPLSYTVTRSPVASATYRSVSPENIVTKSPNEETRLINIPTAPETTEPELPGGGYLYSPDAVTRTVQIEPAARVNSRPESANNRPVGPIRPKSAHSDDAATNTESKSEETSNQTKPNENENEDLPRPSSVRSHDYNHCTNSATGDLRIHEVKSNGKSITLINMSADKEEDIGGYSIQQQVGGHPVAVFRFPSKTSFAPKSYMTVYSGCNDTIMHQPPTQFVWKEQELWGTGPECTTIFCKPNGQAIAWTTAAHRFGGTEVKKASNVRSSPINQLPAFVRNSNAPPEEPVYLQREKKSPPLLAAPKHPHGNNQLEVHPQYNANRVADLGNDNSSNQRQSRSQSAVPDPVPGELYSGKVGQRMGSSTMRRYTPLTASGNVRKNGMITNRVEPGEVSDNPNPFMTPRNRYTYGVKQIQSQHHVDFKPPMPRPPLFSSW